MDYTTMCAKVVVTHVTSYDILFGGVVPYPLGIMLDFWEEIVYYQLGWQIGASHKALLPMTFIRRQTKNSNKSIMLVRFLGLPHGFELLECDIHD